MDTSTLDGGLDAYGGGSVIGCCVTFIILCTLFLGLRFFSLRFDSRPTSIEDWVMIPAWVLMMGLAANVILSMSNSLFGYLPMDFSLITYRYLGVRIGGVGRHEAFILEQNPQTLGTWAQTLFVVILLHAPLMALEKTSILLLYRRIFSIQPWFRISTTILIVYIWCWAASEFLVAIFQCKPVAYQWNKELNGTCIDQLAFFRWISVPNLIHDIAMLVLPLPMIWNLQVGTRQKFALSLVFLIGSLYVIFPGLCSVFNSKDTNSSVSGCVASIIRMTIFFNLNAFSDNTWASIQLMSWTIAEPGTILICACMPALWPMFLRYVPGLGSRLAGSSNKSGNLSGTNDSKLRNKNWRAPLQPAHSEDSLSPLEVSAGLESQYAMSPLTNGHMNGDRVMAHIPSSYIYDGSQDIGSRTVHIIQKQG